MSQEIAENHKQWLIDLQAYTESGMTRKEWCQLHHLKLSTFNYRQQRIKAQISGRESAETYSAPPQIEFAEIPSIAYGEPQNSSLSSIEIELAHAKVTFPLAATAVQIKTVLEVLLYAE